MFPILEGLMKANPTHRQVLKFAEEVLEFPWQFLQSVRRKKKKRNVSVELLEFHGSM